MGGAESGTALPASEKLRSPVFTLIDLYTYSTSRSSRHLTAFAHCLWYTTPMVQGQTYAGYVAYPLGRSICFL